MDKLEPWEKPWIRDFRGTNRARPDDIDRGLAPKPSVRKSSDSVPRQRPSAAVKPAVRPPARSKLRTDRSSGEPANWNITGLNENGRRYGRIKTETGTGGPPFRPPQPYSKSSANGYEYRQDRFLGKARLPQLGSFVAQEAMNNLQEDPNQFFPFQVIGLNGERSIELGSSYILTNRDVSPIFPLPPGKFPVMVTEVTKNSFTFTTQEGHFDPKGSTITFTTWAGSSGDVHLEHLGIANDPIPSPIYKPAPYMAAKAWDLQAENLRRSLHDLN